MNPIAANRFRGFSLIELLMVLLIVGILAGAAGPQFGAMMKRQTLLSESRRITSLLKLARNEARTRASAVVLLRTDSANWSGGIQVFEDIGNDGGFTANTDEVVRMATASGRIVSAAANIDNNDVITFTPRGWANPVTIAICASAANATDGRLIVVNRVGKIQERAMVDGDSCVQ